MSYDFYIPDEKNQPIKHASLNNSVIIIGANGSGKTRLGEWLEKRDMTNTHRISAQRSLVFGSYIQQRSYEQATKMLLYGSENNHNSHDNRWGYDGEKYNYTTSLLNDYEVALSALLALKNKQQERYISECKEREKEGQIHHNVPYMATDVLQQIWKAVFPQRNINFDDGKVTAVYLDKGTEKEYRGRDMSDGERVALYLIAQALSVPEGKTIIIDEPEIHLHRSIMNRLWTAIEKERQDCLFIYITHDTQFAANHSQAKKFWVKSYDGNYWDLSEIHESSLPEDLLLNILGNRRPVLFVEGTSDSYDTMLYSELYKDYYVVPCGSCSRVSAQTKAMKESTQLHHLDCYGIIDRDFRSDYEINKLKRDDIYTVRVAEVENLFLIEELLDIVNTILGFTDTSKIDMVKNYVINERFGPQMNRQICDAIISELKYQLSTANIFGTNEIEVNQSLSDLYRKIIVEDIKTNWERVFTEVQISNEYTKVLEVFNNKSIAKTIGHFFGLKDNEYCDFIIRQLNGNKAKEIKLAIAKYLPTEIPLEIID